MAASFGPSGLHQRRALPGVVLREQALDRFLGREVRIAVIEVAVGKREVHRLVHRVDVAPAVVAHALQVEVLEDVERLQHRRALGPAVELVHVDAAIRRVPRLLELDAPVREVVLRDLAALFLRAAHELVGDVAAVEAVVGRLQRFLARLAGLQRIRFGLDQLAQRRGEVGLAEDLARDRRLARLARVRQHHGLRVRPLLELALLQFDAIRGLGVDRVAVRERDRGAEHLRERERAVLREHRDERAGRAGRHRGQRAVLGRVLEALPLEELRRRAGRRDAEPVDRDDLLRLRVVDEGLGLAAPGEHVPHRRRRREHRAGGVDRVAAALEHARAGGRRERLARDRHPVRAVQRRLLRLLLRERGRDREHGDECRRSRGPKRMAHAVTPQIRSFTPSRSSRSSLCVASMRSRLNSSIASPCTTAYCPSLQVTGYE